MRKIFIGNNTIPHNITFYEFQSINENSNTRNAPLIA